jgi:hypothetical protein
LPLWADSLYIPQEHLSYSERYLKNCLPTQRNALHKKTLALYFETETKHVKHILVYYFTTLKPRKMRWAGRVARMEKNYAHMLLVGKPEGWRSLG